MSVRSKLKFRRPRSIVEHVGVHSMFKEWCWFAIKWCKSHHYNFSGSGMGKQIYYYFLEYLVRMFTNPCYVLAFETLTFNLSSDCTKVRTTWKTHLFSSKIQEFFSPTHKIDYFHSINLGIKTQTVPFKNVWKNSGTYPKVQLSKRDWTITLDYNI